MNPNLNSLIFDKVFTPPHPKCVRKSTGEVTLGLAGNRSKKSKTSGSASFAAKIIQLKF